MPKILIIAGDNSGDLHSSNLMKELKLIIPNIEFVGIGGDLMTQQGLSSIVSLKDISVVGFWEVAKKITFFKTLFTKIKKIIEDEKIDIFIPVDFPGFNQRVAKIAKHNGVSVLWYIAPQLWAWGERRSVHFAELIDTLLVVFPFEKTYFEKFGIKTEFVGHPLLDIPIFQKEPIAFNKRENKILFMPGSRLQELKKHFNLLYETSKLVEKNYPDYQSVFSVPSSLNLELSKLMGNKKVLITNNSHYEMQTSKIGVIKTGTSNLEAALSYLPFVMYYKTSLITYSLGKKLINLNFLSLINILSNKLIIKELIQSDANPMNLFKEISQLIENKEYCINIIDSFQQIKEKIGKTGASKNAAEIIANKIFK